MGPGGRPAEPRLSGPDFLYQECCDVPTYSTMYIVIDWVWGNSKFVVPETLTIDRGEAEFNSQGRGDNKLAIPEYTVYKYCIIPKNIRLIFEWSPQNDKDQ
jgi:hypothetical protein